MAFSGNYGFFRDELYHIVSGQHLHSGYVDFPPMIALLAGLMHAVSQDSLVAIHIIPSLAGAGLVFASGMIARGLGGKRSAQVLTALATMFTLVFMASASEFTMDILDALWWTLSGFVLIRLIRDQQPAAMDLFWDSCWFRSSYKTDDVFFLFALLIAILLTPARSYLRTKWFWMGALIILLFLSPMIIWNVQNHFPTVQFYFNYGGLTGGGPLGFFLFQLDWN